MGLCHLVDLERRARVPRRDAPDRQSDARIAFHRETQRARRGHERLGRDGALGVGGGRRPEYVDENPPHVLFRDRFVGPHGGTRRRSFQDFDGRREVHGHEQLARVESRQLADDRRAVDEARGRELTRREIEPRDPDRPPRAPFERAQKMIHPSVELLAIGDEPRRDDPHDGARHDAPRLRWVGHLFADGDLVPQGEKPRDVARRRMVRNPGHGDLVRRALVAAGQREIERARRQDGVVVEHLVEIPHPKKKDRVRMRRLGGVVLPHHRGERLLCSIFAVHGETLEPLAQKSHLVPFAESEPMSKRPSPWDTASGTAS
jgi:hypothetical protein